MYVYCVVAHSSVSPIANGNSDMTFFLDGQKVGAFVLAPMGEDAYDYNVPVYANRSIQPGLHTVTIQNGRAGDPKSLMLLDYIVYTYVLVPDCVNSTFLISFCSTGKPESTSSSPSSSLSPSSLSSSPSSPSHTRTTTIIAAVVPSVIALLFAISLVFCCCSRRRKRHGYYDTPGSGIASTTGVDGRNWSPVAFTPRVGTAPAAPMFVPESTRTETYPLAGEASSQQPYAAASGSGLNISSCTERSSGPVPHGSSKAEEVGMVLLSPAGLRLLPTLSTSSTQTSAQASSSRTLLSSDVPPDIPCNGIGHI